MEPNKDIPPPLPPIIDQLKEYAETRIKLAKYQAIEGGSSIAASIVADLVTVVCALFALSFASFTLAFFLADVLHSYWAGFGCVTLLYVIIAIIAKSSKKTIQVPFANAMIRKAFKN